MMPMMRLSPSLGRRSKQRCGKHRKTGRSSKTDNLQAAIKAFEAALTVRTREALPQDWASTQNNLGVAYWGRISGSKASNLSFYWRTKDEA